MRVFSADHFFMRDGVYKFDPQLLPQAHGKCLSDFAEHIRIVNTRGVVVMRGVPGAGKSTLLQADNQQLDRLLTADLRRRFSAFDVAVDNTSTSVAEVAPYASLAAAYGVPVEVWTLCVESSRAKNIHGVPDAAVARMSMRLDQENSSFPPFWTHRILYRSYDEAGTWSEE